MRLSCLQDTLDKGLSTVSRAVASRTTLFAIEDESRKDGSQTKPQTMPQQTPSSR